MIIGMVVVSTKEFPPDIRVEKEIKALVKAGHQLFVLSPKLNPDSKREEFIEELGATVVRMEIESAAGKYVKNAIRAITMFDFRWKSNIEKFIKDYSIEVLHVHDLFIVPVGVKVAKKFRVPVVADLHENMPAAMRAARSTYSLWRYLIDGIINNYYIMRWHESRVLRECIKTILVVPEAASRIYKYGISEEDVIIVSNTEDETTFKFEPKQADKQITAAYEDNFMISYIGGMGIHRGLDTTLKAVPHIIKKIKNFKLLIVGVDDKSRVIISNLVVKLNIQKYVEVLSWQPFKKVNSYVMASDICLVPHNDFEHTQTTIPHKLFQYMICGKPVLVSDCKPLERVVNQADSGRVFKANDEKSLADEVFEMYKDRDQLAQYGLNGQKAALGPMSWRKDSKKLIDAYESISAKFGK